MRLKLAGRDRRKLVCSPLDEPLASNRVSDCLHAQFSWLKILQRQRLPPRVVAAEAETTPRHLLLATCFSCPKMIKYPITMAFKVSYRGNNGAQESIIIDAASRPQLFAIGLKPL